MYIKANGDCLGCPFRSDGSQGVRWGDLTRGNSRRGIRLEPLRSDGSHDSRAWRLDCLDGGQKTLNEINLNSRGGIRVESTQIRWFS
jgi:hypothetical protein